jgi:hypothetical protein
MFKIIWTNISDYIRTNICDYILLLILYYFFIIDIGVSIRMVIIINTSTSSCHKE